MASPGDHLPDDTYIRRRERFLRLLADCRKRLEDYALAMTRNVDDAHDLIAETVLRAFEGFDALRDDQAFLAYLFTIASREHQRRRRRARWFAPFDEERAERMPFRGTMPDVSVDVRLLYDAIDRLPVREREAIVLFEITGLSLKEVQAVQGGSIGSIKVRLHRARKRLARLLGVEDKGRAGEPAQSGHRRVARLGGDLPITVELPMHE